MPLLGYKQTKEHKRKKKESFKGIIMSFEQRKKLSILNTTHGESGHNGKKTPEYACWVSLKSRCKNPKVRNYRDYGGRNIKVSSEWKNSYEQFLKDMGRKPGKDYSIERINNNDNYCKENCKWILTKLQNRNRRNSVIFEGETTAEA